MAEENSEIRFIIGQNSYYVNGIEKSIDVAPCVKDGRTYLPLRAAANAVGITDSNINWNAENQTVSLKKDAMVLGFIVGSTEMRVNQLSIKMDVPTEIIDGRVMLPIKWLAQALNCDTSWEASTQTVTIKPRKTLETLSLPGENWGLVFDLNGFDIKEEQVREDNRGCMVFAASDEKASAVSIYLEEEKAAANNQQVRDFYWNKLNSDTTKRENVIMRENDQMSILEYEVKINGPITATQKHYHAYIGRGRIYIDIHFSQMDFKPGDEKAFEAFLSKVKIVEPTSEELFAAGCAYYLKKDYQNAALMYEKALDMEKKERKLPQDEWRVLVDSLAMAYGIPGNLTKAKETLEYGISKEPTYPNFYYSLACDYAEMGDMQKTLDNLELAFKYKDNIIKGEKFPDPLTDSSFAKFMEKEEFKNALEKIMK